MPTNICLYKKSWNFDLKKNGNKKVEFSDFEIFFKFSDFSKKNSSEFQILRQKQYYKILNFSKNSNILRIFKICWDFLTLSDDSQF